jgi:hypothetical protein
MISTNKFNNYITFKQAFCYKVEWVKLKKTGVLHF